MSACEEIELALLGRLYRRVMKIADWSHDEMDAVFDQLKKTLRNGEYRSAMTIGSVIVDEFAQPIVGRDQNVFDNEIFTGESLL